MQYPSRSEYCSSVRNPQFAFRKKDPLTRLERDLDSSLVMGKPVERRSFDGTTALWSASGSFGVVFKYETFSPSKIWALKCFCRSNFEVVDRYKKTLSRLAKNPCDAYFVQFSLLEEGIRVLGHCYPLIKMEWVEGENLKKFLKTNLGNKNLLRQLAALFLKLSNDFRAADIAHGDLQHGNILIVNHCNQLAIKLIDYDSLYFAGDGSEDNIKGIADYQHPLRGSLKKRCREIDFFSQSVIYLSILALAENSNLWDIYRLDEREGLLFSRLDFQNPHGAAVFKSLSQLPAPIPALANQLKSICQLKDFAKIPALAKVLGQEESLALPRQSFSELTLGSPPLINPRLLWQKGRDWLSHNASAQPTAATGSAAPDLEPAQVNQPAQLPVLVAPVPVAAVPINRSLAPKSLGWDPRPYKTNSPPSQIPKTESAIALYKPAIAHNPSHFLHELIDGWKAGLQKADQDFRQTYTQIYRQGIRQVAGLQLKLDQTLRGAIDKLRSQPQALTWTTSEITAYFDWSVAWCHQQRYRFPSQFRAGIHYFKDEAGQIQWTKRGIRQLHRLHEAQQTLPSSTTLLLTKEVSQKLQVAPERITKIKAKHAAQFLEGSHYHTDARRRYYWTLEGIAQLEKLLFEHPPESSSL
ncbi:MAG: hypothetical protein KME35_10850 [Aphanocapsa sp. GSE-SYN-MK-11-07L]|jgi:serine/threonine protein kinase|nr:hypothetical protein [Aphanocapsa sp. GSE-SYN-MK-11-07L]